MTVADCDAGESVFDPRSLRRLAMDDRIREASAGLLGEVTGSYAVLATAADGATGTCCAPWPALAGWAAGRVAARGPAIGL